MNALDNHRKSIGMTISEYCSWLDIAHNTYRKINTGNIDNLYVSILLRVVRKTKLTLDIIAPRSEIVKLIKK